MSLPLKIKILDNPSLFLFYFIQVQDLRISLFCLKSFKKSNPILIFNLKYISLLFLDNL